MSIARERLAAEVRRTGSALSVGIEPAPEHLPRGFEPTIPGYNAFFRAMIDSLAGHVGAFKFNLAFFEALGPRGWQLLHDLRGHVGRRAYVIADAKRGDIGSTAQRYATALLDSLDADAATLSPLMGRDSLEPFLARPDKLSFILALTSNPGAQDFLLHDGLAWRIVSAVRQWDAHSCAGFVTGATRPELLARLRELAPDAPLLIPGVGAQGGDLAATLAALRDGTGPALVHVTRDLIRGIDPGADPFDFIRARAAWWNARIANGGSE